MLVLVCLERQNGRRRHSFLGHLRIQVQPSEDVLICRSSSMEPSGNANEVADDTYWAVLVLGPSEIRTQSLDDTRRPISRCLFIA